MSATKTGLELITRHLPAGCSASLVKVGCSGVVLVLVQRKAGQEEQQQSGGDGPAVAEDGTPQEAAATPGSNDQTTSSSSGGALDMVEVAAAALAEVESGRASRPRCGLVPINACSGCTSGCLCWRSSQHLCCPTIATNQTTSQSTNQPRFVERIIPAQTTCELLAGPLKAAAEAVCRQYVAGLKEGAADDGPLEFAGACAWVLFATGSWEPRW